MSDPIPKMLDPMDSVKRSDDEPGSSFTSLVSDPSPKMLELMDSVKRFADELGSSFTSVINYDKDEKPIAAVFAVSGDEETAAAVKSFARLQKWFEDRAERARLTVTAVAVDQQGPEACGE